MDQTNSKFIIRNINILGTYTYNLNNIDCTICRCNLNEQSLQYQDKGLDSKVVSGICGHAFHHECITPWISARNKNCPICAQTWILKN
jgi:hypothetical protein